MAGMGSLFGSGVSGGQFGSITSGMAEAFGESSGGGDLGGILGNDGPGRQERQQAELGLRGTELQLKAAERRNRVSGQLESLLQKLLNNDPVSPAERNTLNKATKIADQQIQKATKDSVAQTLQAQAGTGFLKGGRTADQIRKLSIEGSLGRQQIAVAREQQLQNMVDRNKQFALQTAGLVTGTGIPQFQQFQMGPSARDQRNAALAQAGVAGMNLYGQMNAQQPQQQQQLGQPMESSVMMTAPQESPFSGGGGSSINSNVMTR